MAIRRYLNQREWKTNFVSDTQKASKQKIKLCSALLSSGRETGETGDDFSDVEC